MQEDVNETIIEEMRKTRRKKEEEKAESPAVVGARVN